jgi:hypothetical protein
MFCNPTRKEACKRMLSPIECTRQHEAQSDGVQKTRVIHEAIG